MGAYRTGTVGYSYRDWIGPFYPKGTSLRRQIKMYLNYFNVCELTQFVHQMPTFERVIRLENQLNSRHLKVYVRLHRTLTQCSDTAFATTVAKHFRASMQPLIDANKFGGFVASFPYAFRKSTANQDYVVALSTWLKVQGVPFQVDFRHPSWLPESSGPTFDWMHTHNLGYVCVDEPDLPGLVKPLAIATTKHVLVRLHGRNADGWWSGNPMSRYDYLYSDEELDAMVDHYKDLLKPGCTVDFIFQNHWQAQAVANAMSWSERLKALQSETGTVYGERSQSWTTKESSDDDSDQESYRPPVSLPMQEIKARVNRVLSTDSQMPLTLPPREY